MVTFAVLVWFVMRFLWEPMTAMMAERTTRIADGLAAAERGKHEQQLAEQRSVTILREARAKGGDIENRAGRRASEIIDEAKGQARVEGERLLNAARAEIEQEVNRAREQLRAKVAELALAGAEKILAREIDVKAHQEILDEVVEQI